MALLTSNAKSSSHTVPIALPASKSLPNNRSNIGTAKRKEELILHKQDAFTIIMGGQQMKEKAEKEQKKKAGPSTSSQPRRPEKQKVTARNRMRGKQKGKPQKHMQYAPNEEDEDSHTEAELTAPTEDQSRFVASSKSPEPYSSTQSVKAFMSEDAVTTTRLGIEVKSRNTTTSERKVFDNGLMPLIGDTEATAAVPSEKVAETAPLQPPPAEEIAKSTNLLTTLVPSESGKLRKPQMSKLPQGKRRQPTSAPTVDRVTRSVSLKQKVKADTHLQPGMFQALSQVDDLADINFNSATKGDLPVPAKRTASGSIKGLVPAQKHIEETPLPSGSPMKLSSPVKPTIPDISMTEDRVRTTQTDANQPLPGKMPDKSRIPVKPISSPSPSKLARTISRFSSNPDGKFLDYY